MWLLFSLVRSDTFLTLNVISYPLLKYQRPLSCCISNVVTVYTSQYLRNIFVKVVGIVNKAASVRVT